MRFIWLVFIALIIIVLWKLALRIFSVVKLFHNAKKQLTGEQMVQCTLCQLYILQSKAYIYNDKHYCCKDHAKMHKDAK